MLKAIDRTVYHLYRAESEDIEVQSAVVSFLSEQDLEHGMGIAAIAGQMSVAGEIVALREMPVLAAFLKTAGNDLHDYAVNSIIKFAASRALGQAMMQTAGRVGEMGAGEMAEGMTRVGVAGRVADASDQMAARGARNLAGGILEVDASMQIGQVAQELAVQGAGEVAAGARRVGQAEALDAAAEALKARAK